MAFCCCITAWLICWPTSAFCFATASHRGRRCRILRHARLSAAVDTGEHLLGVEETLIGGLPYPRETARGIALT